MSSWIKIAGTQTGEFTLGTTGVKLKNDAGNLDVRTNDDSAYAAAFAANVVVVNDATGFAVDLAASPDQTANYVFTLPPNVGVSGQFLQTAANGTYTWETAVQPGSMMTDTMTAVAGQTGFTITYAAAGDVTFALNGATVATTAATVVGSLVTYVPAQNAGYVIEAGDEITISYLYGTVAAGDLNSLSDVDVIAPTNGSVLTYNAATQLWVVGAGVTDPTAVTNGSSNVSIPSVSGNVSVSAAGVANVLVVTPAGGNVTGNLDVTDTFTTVNANVSGNVVVLGNIDVPTGSTNTFDLLVGNDAVITGNLNVLGNLNTTTTNTFAISGPIFEFGGSSNGSPLVINDGMDRGALLDYYNGAPLQSFMGWKNANAEFVFGSKVSNVNNLITVAELGNLRGDTFFGNVIGGNITGNLIGNIQGNLVNGTSNVTIPANSGDVIIAAGGVSELTVSSTGANILGNLAIGLHADIAGNLTVMGQTALGAVANVHITGGSNGQFLQTNGAGNLTWADLTANTLVNGNSNVIVLANGAVNISSTGNANVVSISGSAANITGNLLVTGVTRLNTIGNVIINGGANGQVITTDGAGNLSFTTPIVPSIINGNSNVIVAANGNVSTSVTGVANVFVVSPAGTVTTGNTVATGNITGLSLNSTAQAVIGTSLTVGTNAIVNANANIGGIANIAGNLIAQSNASIAQNVTIGNSLSVANNFSVMADANFSAVANVHIPGGVNGQFLRTDGTGNLSFATINTALAVQDEGVLVAPTANTINFVGSQVTTTAVGNVVTVNLLQLDPATIVNGNSNVIVTANGNVSTSVTGVANVFVVTGTGANLNGDLSVTGKATFSSVANVLIPGGTAGQSLSTDGAGNLTWTSGLPSSKILNGTSNVSIDTSAGNVTVGVAGVANIVDIGATQTTFNNDVTVLANIVAVGNITGSNLLLSAGGQITTPAGTNSDVVINPDGVGLFVVTDITPTVLGNSVQVKGEFHANANLVDLGDVANVHIYGGTAGQVLGTDGTGNLSWIVGGGGGSSNAQPSIEFVALTDGVNQTFTDANIAALVSNAFSTVYVNGVLARTSDYAITGTDLVFTRELLTGDEITATSVNVSTSVPQTAITNGTSSVVALPSGNVSTSVAGNVNVLVVTGTGANVTGTLGVSGNATIVGSANVGNLSVTGKTTFSSVANVLIPGGANTQVLSTDGLGNLSWINQSGGGSSSVVTVTPAIEFVATTSGNALSFTDANIANIASNTQCSVFINGSLTPTSTYTIVGDAITFNRQINANNTIAISAFSVQSVAITGAGGANSQLQYNNAGNISGITTATFDGTALSLGSNANVKISGGTSGQVLQTNGSGILSWTTPTALAAGLPTQLLYNNAGNIGGLANVTFDGTNLSLGSVSTLKVAGGAAGQALVTDGAGTLSFGGAQLSSWTNAGTTVIGAVTTAPTKGTPVNDFVRYRKIAPKEYQVQMMYSQSTAGTAGSGDYLFTLPAGLQFDFTQLGQKITSGTMSNTVAPVAVTLGLPGGAAGIVNGSGGTSTWVAPVIVIPYSATQFRLFSASALSTTGTLTQIASNTFNLSDAATGYNLNFSFIATA